LKKEEVGPWGTESLRFVDKREDSENAPKESFHELSQIHAKS
jgi:hypothetical protein